jgi:hypothetical protein
VHVKKNLATDAEASSTVDRADLLDGDEVCHQLLLVAREVSTGVRVIGGLTGLHGEEKERGVFIRF